MDGSAVLWYGIWQFGTCAKGFIGRIIVDHQQGAHHVKLDGGSQDPDRATAMILLGCVGTSSPCLLVALPRYS